MPRIVQCLLIAFDLVLIVRVLNGRFHIGQIKPGLGRGVFQMVTLVPIFCPAPNKLRDIGGKINSFASALGFYGVAK